MRSTRASAAWAAVAVATSLLSMAIMTAQTTTNVATGGVIPTSQIDSDRPLERTQNVVARRSEPTPPAGSNAPLSGGVLEVAALPPR